MSGVDNHEAPGLPADESHPLWSLFRFKSQWGAQGVQFVGAWEFAPWPLLGSGLRAAWTASDRLRERRAGAELAADLSWCSGPLGTRAPARRCASRASGRAPGWSGPGCTGPGSTAAR